MLDMITIIDYGVSNVISRLNTRNMIKSLRVDSQITSDPIRTERANRIMPPGRGTASHGVENLQNRGWVDALNRKFLTEQISIADICIDIRRAMLISNQIS